MVVEDESVISLDIRNSLTKLGYAISGAATSGEVALRKIEKNRPDVILMDIHLKGEMTGIDVSRKVKSEFQIPIVYLTANADDSTFKEAQNTDPFGFILKPFEERELGIAIEIALNKHKKEQVVRASESWYATAFQSLSEAVIATDPQGNIVFMNAAAESITGWSLTEAIDRPATGILRFQRGVQQLDDISSPGCFDSILNAVLKDRVEVPFPADAQLEIEATGKRIPIVGKGLVLEDPSGSIIGGLLMFQAIYTGAAKSSEAMSASISDRPQTIDFLNPLASNVDETAQSKIQAIEEVDPADVELIKAFVQALVKKHPFASSTEHLIASAEEGQARLTGRIDGVIVSTKSSAEKLTIVVNEKSSYERVVSHFLVENQFFPLRRRTDGHCHYQRCKVPDHCQVYHTDGIELWNAWHGKTMPGQPSSDRVRYPILRENIVVFRRGSWYRIQKIGMVQERINIKTIGGEIYLTTAEPLVWGIQSY